MLSQQIICISYCTHTRTITDITDGGKVGLPEQRSRAQPETVRGQPDFPRVCSAITDLYYSSSLSSISITRAEPLTVLHCMHTRSAMLCTQMTLNYCLVSLSVAIGACNNLHYYPQMEQFDWSEMTYYILSMRYCMDMT